MAKEKERHPVKVPETGGKPDRSQLSGTGTAQVDEVLIDIYFNQYLIDDLGLGGSGDYLVHSAELLCTNRRGNSKAYLRMKETIDADGNRMIGHGAVINGLPQANKNDAKAGENIDSFGNCKLLSYEETDIQRANISAAGGAGCDVCSYLMKLNASWITPSESGLMEIGGDKAITTDSFLLCNPVKIQAYADQGIKGGKIQAADSGQNHLDQLLDQYEAEYIAALKLAVSPPPLFDRFTMQMVYEFVYLYEVRYPERERALVNFFREVDANYLDHILKLKCMIYMLEERAVRRMTELMKQEDGLFIEMFFKTNTKKGGAQAFFSHTILGKPKIVCYEIVSKSGDIPPYKTIFHEFGHAIDSVSKEGSGYYSEDFRFSQTAGRLELIYDPSLGTFYIDTVTDIYEKTIHEWAQMDLEYILIQVAVDLLLNRISGVPSLAQYLGSAVTPLTQFKAADYAIHDLIFYWNGAKKLKNLSNISYANETEDLYNDICWVMEKNKLVSSTGTPVLPRDLFGGITNNQVGGGHPSSYWFNICGKRKQDISKEAFAGYFEYRLTIPDYAVQQAVINPNSCLPYTRHALEAMFNNVV